MCIRDSFIGILLEHYAGHLPFWLAPRQVVVATITSEADAYAQEVARRMRDAGLRARTDLRNEKINYKVREHSLTKTPVIIALGKREVEARTVSVRRLGRRGQEVMGLDEATAWLADTARARRGPMIATRTGGAAADPAGRSDAHHQL